MSNGEWPAFPVDVPGRPHGKAGPTRHYFTGISARDYFAARAPECPFYFEHVGLPQDFPPMPDFMALGCKEHQDIAKSWKDDPCFDLPEELAWFGKKVVAHRAARDKWNRDDAISRLIQWRWYYADAMIAQRGKG